MTTNHQLTIREKKCPMCNNMFVDGSSKNSRRYCTEKCSKIKIHQSNIEGQRIKRAKKRAKKICTVCGQVGLEPHQLIYCTQCAGKSWGIKQGNKYGSHKIHLTEYIELLENAETINMRGFIRLQVLSEMFGRDLEEWVNSVPRFAELQARLMKDRDAFDKGVEKANSPEYLAELEKVAARVERKKELRRKYAMERKYKKACEAWNEVGI